MILSRRRINDFLDLKLKRAALKPYLDAFERASVGA